MLTVVYHTWRVSLKKIPVNRYEECAKSILLYMEDMMYM
jgi:hypothetical protein